VLSSQNRVQLAVASAVAGGALAAVTVGAFASGGSVAPRAFTGCGYGYDPEVGYGYGYGICPEPSPSASASASASASPSATSSPSGSPTASRTPSPTASPTSTAVPIVCVPSVKLDGGTIKRGQRKGVTARCLRPNRVAKVFVVERGKTRLLKRVTVNQFGTVRTTYKARFRGKVTISFVGAAFDGTTLRKKLTFRVR
jgi:hypothetical protein